MEKPRRYSPEVRRRAVRTLRERRAEHESWRAAMGSIAAKLGCTDHATFRG